MSCRGLPCDDRTDHTGLRRVLLVGSETMSRIIDWEDRNTAVLFGDGAGAVVLEAVDGPGEMLAWDLGSDGGARHLLYADTGGYLKMDGKEVFRKAVRVTVESVTAALTALSAPAEGGVR